MEFSLNMLQSELQKRGFFSTISSRTHTFFKNIQLLRETSVKLTSEYLYIPYKLDFDCTILPDDISIILDKIPENPIRCSYLAFSGEDTFDKIINEIFEILNSFHKLEQELTNCCFQKKTLQDAVDVLSAFMKNPAYVIDSSYKLLAIDSSEDLKFSSITLKRLIEQKYMPINTVIKILNSEIWSQAKFSNTPILMNMKEFYCPFINYRILDHNKLQGFLIVVGLKCHLMPGDLDLIQKIMPYINQLAMNEITSPSYKGNYYEHFFKDVISGNLKTQELIAEQLTPIQWKLQDTFCILISQLNPHNEDLNQTVFNRIMHIENGKPVIFDDFLYCIFKIDSTQKYQQIIQETTQLFNIFKHKAGISEPFTGFHKLSHYAKQAKVALTIGAEMAPEIKLYQYADFKLQHIFKICEQEIDIHTCIHSAITKLEQHDIENDTEYSFTLYQYLRNERKLVDTAKCLNIHRNTLLYRIEKLHNLVDLNLEDPNIRLWLLLCYEMKKYLSKKSFFADSYQK